MKEQEILNDFSKWVDEKIDFKKMAGGMAGVMLEVIDGALFKFAINYGYDKLTEASRPFVLSVMKEVSSGNLEGIKSESIDQLVYLIKSPLGDETERIILGGVWQMIGELIKKK